MTGRRACAVCGAACPPPFRPPPAETAPDLDGRPGEPTSSTLGRWLAECRNCGHVAPDLSVPPPAGVEALGGEPYRALRRAELPAAVRRQRQRALLEGDARRRAEARMAAAWAADDAGRDDLAAQDRRDAAALLPIEDAQDALRRLDLLRRAGADTAAALAAADALAADENSARVLAFQRRLLAAGDRGRHRLSAALRPPAHTPHATHRAGGSGGWLRRLFGG